MAIDDAEREWPAVARAYDFVMPSYQWLVSRYESAEGRLTTLITIAATVMFGIPVFAKNLRPDISFSSFWFRAAILCLLAAGIAGVVGRVRGRVVLPNPKILYDHLHESEWEFRKNAIYYAGEHFEANRRTIEWKHRLADLASGCLLLAALAAVAWLLAS